MRLVRRLRLRCDRAKTACTQPVLEHWLEACGHLALRDLGATPIIAVDLEMTGMDPARDRIVAMGWTGIVDGRIRLGENRHLLVRSDRSVGVSATIHGLLDRDVATGVSLAEALTALFTAARGRVLLFHHAGLDAPFLQHACRNWAGCEPPLPALDTLWMARRRMERRGQNVAPGDLRLGALRRRHGLPDYPEHDALSDAVATAELFLAMIAHAGGGQPLGLASMVRIY